MPTFKRYVLEERGHYMEAYYASASDANRTSVLDRWRRGWDACHLCSITLYQFRLLIPRAQLLHILIAGTYLAQRWEQQGGINFYYLSGEGCGFFAEVGYNKATLETMVLCSFSSSVPLEEYAYGVRLPAL